jgi:hypothetical protein
MAKKLFPVFAIILLVLLSGCLDRLPENQRLYCLDLTEKSFAFVPECKSQQECFSKLSKRFFSFPQESLSSQTRESLNAYRNNVAQSWLYFNNAKKSISQIRSICRANNNMAGLIFHLNELTHNMAKAFEYADKANRQSFEILALEQADLNKQDIHLAREEPLFQDFAAITDNLNSLHSNSCQKQNLACFYLRQTASFESLVRQTGFQDKILSQTNIFGLAETYSDSFSETSLPLIGQALSPILSFLSNLSNARKAIQGLEAASAFQFIQVYGNFVGTSNSCLEKFSVIIQNDAINRSALIERNKMLEQQAWASLQETEQTINSLLSEEYASFDQNFFQSLYSGLGQESGIAAQKYSIRDFGELHQQADYKLHSLKQRLLGLQKQDTLGQLSLGRKATELKTLNAEIALLKENLNFLSSEIINGLLVLCGQRADFIETKIDEASLPKDYLVNAIDLKARTEFKAKLFRQATGKERLLQCREMVLEFERFEKALKDFQDYKLQESLSLESCFSWLDKTFKDAEQSNISLNDFLFRLHELKQLEKPYPDLEFVQRNCLSLKEDITHFIEGQDRVQNIEQNFSRSSALFSYLQEANEKELFPSSKIASLKKQLSYFQGFFQEGKLVLGKALALLPDLGASLHEFHALLEQESNAIRLLLADQNASVQIDQNHFSQTDQNNSAQSSQNNSRQPTQEPDSLSQEISTGLDKFSSLVLKAEESLSSLESLFANVSDETIISAKYLPPISRAEIEKAKLSLSSLRSFLEKNRLQDLNSSSAKSLASLKTSLDKKLSQAESLSQRLESSFNTIKEDAVVSYNAAVELFNHQPENPEARDSIAQAKEHILQGDFLEAIASSRQASGLTVLSSSPALDFPVFAIPIMAGAGLLLAVRFQKKKNEKQKNELIKKIESNW